MSSRLSYPDDLLNQEWNRIDRLVDLKNTSRECKPLYPRRRNAECHFLLTRNGMWWASFPP